jgi:Fe-S cluster assembly protein SufD
MSAVVDFPVRPEARPYLDAFRPRPGEPEWLLRHRRRALARFAELGFPSRRSETWRYLDLRPLQEAPMLPAAAPSEAGLPRLAEIGLAEPGSRLVLVDGRFAPGLSVLGRLPAGIWLGSMTAAMAERPELVRAAIESETFAVERPFAALNAALFADGFVLEVAPGARLDEPVEIVHLASGSGASLHTRGLVRVGKGGRAVLLESFAGAGGSWRNAALSLRLDADAEFAHAALVEEAAAAWHFGEVEAELGAGARLSAFALLLGGATVRREAAVRVRGEGARCALGGAFLLSGREEANILTAVEHAAPGAETREIFKGVAAGRAHGAFQGRITVRPGAQKTDAHMLSRNLLIGPRAAIDTKPELEIFADDVKCSHGAAVGDLDEAALFYLLSRGIARDEARRMLIEAFLREAVETVDPPPLSRHLLARLGRRLAQLEDQE